MNFQLALATAITEVREGGVAEIEVLYEEADLDGTERRIVATVRRDAWRLGEVASDAIEMRADEP